MQPKLSDSASPAPALAAVAQPGTRTGTLFANIYRLDALLGSGGGDVYRAFDVRSDTSYALKILGSTRSQQLDVVRFRREFRAAARLSHPHCLKVLEVGEAGDLHFIRMELMEGGDLASWEPRDARLVAGVGMQVLAALDHIHAKNIVHRDLKPQNILLKAPATGDQLPWVKLSDFGIAKVSDLDDQASVGSTVGTLAYIAPEQLRGEAGPRSDLYALGCVLWSLLAGAPPFADIDTRNTTDWLAQRRSAVARPLSQMKAGIPEALGSIIMRLLEPAPRDRYATAREAHEALDAWLKPQAAWSLPAHPPLEGRAHLESPNFVGRSAEVATVEGFIAALAEGLPQVLCISGSAGLGKSKLAGHALRTAEALGILVEVGTCRAEPGPAFAPITPLLEALTSHQRQQALTSADAGTLVDAPVVPGLGGAPLTSTGAAQAADFAKHVAAMGDGQGDSRWEFFRGMADALTAITQRRPSLIVLEDAQWADSPTLQLITFLLRSLRTAHAQGIKPRVGFLISHRVSDEHTALSDFYEAGRSLTALQSIRLQPLPTAAAAELVASMLAEPLSPDIEAFTQQLTRASDNNPLFLAQVLLSLVTRGALRRGPEGWRVREAALDNATLPHNIHAAIGERAARFSVHTKELLAGAAVLGRRFSLSMLQRLLASDEASLLDSLDEALRGGFIAERRGESGGYLFEHDGFRESIYQQLDPAARTRLHRETALILEDAHRDNNAAAADLAHHWRSAGDRGKAYDYSLVAARYALETYAYERAVSLYEAGFDDAAQADIAVSRLARDAFGDACVQAGHYSKAATYFGERLADVVALEERVDILRKLGDVEYRCGNTAAAQRPLEEALQLLGVQPLRSPLAFCGWHSPDSRRAYISPCGHRCRRLRSRVPKGAGCWQSARPAMR